MVSSFRLRTHLPGINYERGPAAAFLAPLGDGFVAIAGHGPAVGLRAGVYEMAREISGGVSHCAAPGTAADGARLLFAAGYGAARAARKIVASAVRASTGVHVCGIDRRVARLQPAIRGATGRRFV